MNKRVKKIKIRKGKDSNQAVVRKMLLSFIAHGKLTTTLKRAKITKSIIDRLVYKSREKTEAAKNVLLKHLANNEAVNKLFSEVGPKFKTRVGGYVKLIRLGRRVGDGSEIAKLEWIEPIISLKDGDIKSTTSAAKIPSELVEKIDHTEHKKKEAQENQLEAPKQRKKSTMTKKKTSAK